jgi:amino acid permease
MDKQLLADTEPVAANEREIHKPVASSHHLLAQGSLWGTVWNMCAAIMGAGVLSLPFAISEMGAVPGAAVLICTASATFCSVELICAGLSATGCDDHVTMARHAFGPVCALAVKLAIIVFQFGTLVAYTIAIGDIIEPLLALPGLSRLGLTRAPATTIFWATCMLPLSFVSRISSLQGTSLLGQMGLLCLVAAIVVHFAVDAAAAPALTLGRLALARASPAAASASAIVMSAFSCQVNVPPLYRELRVRTPARMRSVAARAVGICLLCYLLVGLAGAADFPRHTQGNIMRHYCLADPAASAHVARPPRVMVPAFAAIMVTVLVAYPINVFPTRLALDSLCFGRMGERHRTARHVGLTLAITSTSLLTALAVPDISVVFSLMGGTCSAFVCFIMPAAVARQLGEGVPHNRSRLGRAAVAGLGAFGLLVGVCSTATTTYDIFTQRPAAFDACDHEHG